MRQQLCWDSCLYSLSHLQLQRHLEVSQAVDHGTRGSVKVLRLQLSSQFERASTIRIRAPRHDMAMATDTINWAHIPFGSLLRSVALRSRGRAEYLPGAHDHRHLHMHSKDWLKSASFACLESHRPRDRSFIGATHNNLDFAISASVRSAFAKSEGKMKLSVDDR